MRTVAARRAIRTIAEGTRAVTLRAITVRTVAARTVAARRAIRTITERTRTIALGPVAVWAIGRLLRTVAEISLRPRAVTLGAIAVRAVAMRTITMRTITMRARAARRTVRTVAMTATERPRPVAEGTRTAARAAGTATARTLVAATLVAGIAFLAAAHNRRHHRHVFVGRRRHDGDRLTGELLDAAQLAALARVAERHGDARGAGTRGAADAMDVALGVGRQLVVDDVGHALDIDAARGEIGGDQHAGLAAAEVVERLLTSVLALVAVDRLGADAAVLEGLGDAVGAPLGTREHDHTLERLVGQQMAEKLALARRVHVVDALFDLLDRLALGRNLDALGVLQDFRRELGDVVRHGGREQQRLAVLGDRARDAAHVADEAHVEHAIGLVEDEEVHVAELHVAALDEIEQTAGRGDQDVDAARQRLDLAAVAQTADDGAKPEAEAAAVGVEAARDLHRKLSGRRQHERPRALRLGALVGCSKQLQDGQRESRRLAGAGLGNAEHVAALQQGRNGACLDRRRGGVLGSVQGTQQRLGQAEIRKRNFTHWKIVLLAAPRAFRARMCRAAFGPFPRAAGTALALGIVSG